MRRSWHRDREGGSEGGGSAEHPWHIRALHAVSCNPTGSEWPHMHLYGAKSTSRGSLPSRDQGRKPGARPFHAAGRDLRVVQRRKEAPRDVRRPRALAALIQGVEVLVVLA